MDIIDEKYNIKEKLEFQIGEIREKISCSCVSLNQKNNEELVSSLYFSKF